jgi:uncharacterized lipoprotein YddW (UPF0748 family)
MGALTMMPKRRVHVSTARLSLERLEDRTLLAGLNLTVDSLVYANSSAAQGAWVAQEQSAPVTPATGILGQSALQMTANFGTITPPEGATSERAFWDRTFTTPLDFSAYTGFEIAMYSADLSPITGFSISFRTGANDWYRLDIATSQLSTTAWSSVVLDLKSAAVEDGGTPGVVTGWNDIEAIRIAAYALPTQTVDAMFYVHDLKATGKEQIDSFIYSSPGAAQAQWVKYPSLATSGLVSPTTNIAGRDCLAFPANFANDPAAERALWDRTVDLDLSWARGFQFQIYSDNVAPISHITFYLSTGTTWTNYCYADFYVAKPGEWNTVTIDLGTASVSGSPQWSKINVLRLSPWRANNVNTTLYMSDMRVFGGSRQIDSFEYATDAAAQAAWVASPSSSEGPVTMTKSVQGGRALAMPAQFAGATSDPRFNDSSWSRTMALDLSGQRGVQFDVLPDSLASTSGISLQLQTGAGWYEKTIPAAQLVAGQWNTITITRQEMLAEGTPGFWSAITGIRFSVERDQGVAGTDSTVYLRDLRTAEPEILVIRQEDAGASYSAAVVTQFADAGIAFAGISTNEVRADRLDRAKLLVLPYNSNLPSTVTDALVASINGGRKFLGFGRLPWALYTAIGMTVGGYYDSSYSFGSIRPVDSAALPGVPPIVYEASPAAMAANTIAGQSSVLAWWYNTSGANTGIPAVVGSSNGIVMTNVLLTDDVENKKRLMVSMADKLLPGTRASAAVEALDQIGQVGPYTDFPDATSGIAATATANQSTSRTQPYLDSAAAERATAQAARALGDDVAALEAALQGRTSLRQAYSAAQNPAAGELRAFFCSSPYGVPGQTWDTTIKQLAEAGFNAVAVCLADGGGAYYDSNVQAFSDGTMFPRVYDSRGDQLALLVAATQKYGVDLYVWKVNWAIRSWVTPQWFTDRMRSEGRLQLDVNGGELFSGYRWLDPAVPANQDLDVATMVELAGTPGVKGILLDYIRYPGITGSFSPASNAAFQAYLQANSLIGPTDTVVWPAGGSWASRSTFKIDHAGTRTPFLDDGTTYAYDAWITWRQGNITADVARISTEARAANPNIVVTAAVAKNWANERNSMGQDWVAWLTNNYVDSAIPMDYTSYNAQLDNWVTDQQGWASGETIYPAIDGSINPGDLLVNPSDRIVDQILLTRQHHTGGFFVFNLGTSEVTSILPTLGLGTTLVNAPPTISDIADQTTNEDVPTSAIAFTVGDVETPAASLTLSASSSNTALVPNENILFNGSGADRTLIITPALNQSGTTTITVTVSDGELTASDTFVLCVIAVNDAPTLSDIADQTTQEDVTTPAFAFRVDDVETAVGSLTVSGTSSNTTLVPNESIVSSGSGADRTLIITPALNQFGTTTITVTVSDGDLTASDTFVLHLIAVNDAPTISDIADQTTHEDVTTPASAFRVDDAERAAGSLAVSGTSSNTVLVPNENIVFSGSGTDRTLTITPALNQSGTTTITVTVSDGELTASDTFVLCVSPRATYYVDASDGNDAWDGLSGVYLGDNHGPWRTIFKVNASSCFPGDSVLFQRGEAWREQLVPASGNAAGVITYGAYGDPAAPKPLLLGSTERDLASDWIDLGGNIWSTRSVWDSFTTVGPELLTNPSFDTGMTGWYVYASAPASVTGARDTAVYDTAPAGARVMCTASGDASSQIQVFTANSLSVTAGQWYLLSFRAKCTQGFTVPSVILHKGSSPWTSYATGYFSQPAVTTEWATYSVLFQATTTAADAGLDFSLGGALPTGSSFYLDTLSLRRCQFADPRPASNVDVGNIIFNDGQSCGVKRWSADTLQAQGDFWYDANNWTVTLYSTDNPATHYADIELALNRHLITTTSRSYVTCADLDLRYGAADGLNGSNTDHITVEGCDFAFLGGALQSYINGQPVRFGNGITFWNNAHDCLVQCSTFHEIYDVAVTNQGENDRWTPSVAQYNIAYRNNVIWNCEISFNAWVRGTPSTFSHIYFENNTCLNAGGGWSHGQRPDQRGNHLVFWGNDAAVDNYYVRNNICAESTEGSVRFWKPWTDYPGLVLDNNLYYESTGDVIVSVDATYGLSQFAAYQSASGRDLDSWAGEPGFVDPGSLDFRLQAGSLAVDAGADTGIDADFQGGARPRGRACDIGAYEFVATNIDADGNGRADALTDGILILRYLFSPQGAWSYSDAVGVGATQTTREAIANCLNSISDSSLDVDGNGTADALTDGILILRYLFAPTGAWTYSDALGVGATRTTREQIRAFLDQYCPERTPAGRVETPVPSSTEIVGAAVEELLQNFSPLTPGPSPARGEGSNERASEPCAVDIAPVIVSYRKESPAQSIGPAENTAPPVPRPAADSYDIELTDGVRLHCGASLAAPAEVSDLVFNAWSDDRPRVESPSPWGRPRADTGDTTAADEVYGMGELEWLLMKLG